MRARWKILGGTSIASAVVTALIVGQSGEAKSDTTVSVPSGPNPSTPAEDVHDPLTPYPLGPHPIEYDQLSTADKAGVDLIQETTETSQPASSYQAWAAATAYTGQQAEAEIAARGVGLTGTEQDGVVP